MKTKRLLEIDALRGIAVVMMIFYHVLWALNNFGLITFPQINTGFWRAFAFTTAGLFIFLVGVSLTLSYSRIRKTKENYVWKYLKRGISVFGYGLVITFVTYLFFREGLVYFGVLQFIGIGIILAIPFLNFMNITFFAGIYLTVLGILLYKTSAIIPLFGTAGISTFDYFPITPWFGIILVGICFGNYFYPNGKRTFAVPKMPLQGIFAFLGRYSLIIYFIHALIIFGTIFIIKQIWI